MYIPLKKVNFYRRALMAGCTHNLADDGALSLEMENPLLPAAYLAPVFDTEDMDSSYNRLRVEGRFENVRLEIVVAVADTLEAVIDGSPVPLDDYLASPKTPAEDKLAALRELRHVRGAGATDLLLHSLKGRYAWVMVSVHPAGDAVCRIDGLSLEFPKESFTDYFPEIYRQNDFFSRYIAIFQSLYLDLEDRAEALPGQLDYETTSRELVPVLAGWLGLDNCAGLFDAEQMRYLIRHADLFQGKKGTRKALEQILELATGIRPRILEQFDLEAHRLPEERRERFAQLYGKGPDCFCVILDLTSSDRELRLGELGRLIDAYSPMGANHKLVCLRRASHTDTHCYLDVNSVLASPESAAVDDMTLGGYITVG